MHINDIEVGETYFFIGTDSPKRKHLIGHAFTVLEKKKVFRKGWKGRLIKTWRVFNDEKIGARPDELGVMPAVEQIDMEF